MKINKSPLLAQLIFFCIFIILSFKAISQPPDFISQVHPDVNLESTGSKVDCKTAVTVDVLNYIRNPFFRSDPIVNVNDPFPSGAVPDWVETHGSPALSDFLNPASTPPPGIDGYASMYSWGTRESVEGEGIAQVIPAVAKGKQYNLSFFKKLASYLDLRNSMDKFYIVLIHCKDYERIHNYPQYNIPQIPDNAQIIYSESDLNNVNWEQHTSSFEAKDDYNMVWIFPIQDQNVTEILGVDFTGMIITNLDDVDFQCSQQLSLPGCNHIPNPEFGLTDPTVSNQGAFFSGNVAGWNDSHGTCDIDAAALVNASPPIPTPIMPPSGNHYASMGLAQVIYNGQVILNAYEGLAAKIVPVQQGNKYTFSFFVASTATTVYPDAAHNTVLNVVLIKCQNFSNSGAAVPALPPSDPHQSIFCQSFPVVGNSTWRQVVVSFVANDNYDMIRIYPDQTQQATQSFESFFHVADPTLIDITDFTAGPNPSPNFPACSVSIGPDNPPACELPGTMYVWTSPTGTQQTVTSPDLHLYNIDINNPSNVGTWTLSMVVPGVAATNTTCGNNNVQASVYVPGCCTTTITPAGPIEYYYGAAEFNKTLTFTSSSSTGNQWFVDGIPVNGATGQTFDYFWETISNANETHQISVHVSNCPSANVSVNFIPYANSVCPIPITNHCFPAGVNTPVNYCENTAASMQTFNMGSSAVYSWQVSQPTNLITITSQSQHVANINIGTVSSGNVWAYVIAKSELNGHIKYFDYMFWVHPASPGFHPLQGCYNSGNSITLTTQGSYMDNEFYDFGNANVINVIPPLSGPYYFTQHTVYMSGAFTNQPRQIVLQRNGITSYYSSFTNNNYADCTSATSPIPACFWAGEAESKTSGNSRGIDYMNKLNADPLASKTASNIIAIEIYNPIGQLVKKTTGSNEAMMILKSNKAPGLNAGFYFMRIIYKDKTFEVIKRYLL